VVVVVCGTLSEVGCLFDGGGGGLVGMKERDGGGR